MLRGIALLPGPPQASSNDDVVLILDEFDASDASNVTWRLHTQANVAITGTTTAALTQAEGAEQVTVELVALVANCPGAKLRLRHGATDWTPSARVWTGHTAILLNASGDDDRTADVPGAGIRGCRGLQVFIAPSGVRHPGTAHSLADWAAKGPLPM